MKEIDARGFSCPEPVIRTEKAVRAGETEFEVLVDTNVSKENVCRYLEDNGYTVQASELSEGDIKVTARKNG